MSFESPPVFSQRHLLGIEHLSRPEIEALLDLADEAVAISRQVEKKRSTLRGRTQTRKNLHIPAQTGVNMAKGPVLVNFGPLTTAAVWRRPAATGPRGVTMFGT